MAWNNGARVSFALNLGVCGNCAGTPPAFLSFRIRGQRGGEDLHLRVPGRAPVALSRYVAVEPRTLPAVIPLSDLGWAGEAQLRLEGFVPDQGGRVYISDVLLLPSAPPRATGQVTEEVEVFSPSGSIQRLRRPKRFVPVAPAAAALVAAPPPAPVTDIQVTGLPAQRFNMVFVGDGYTSADLGTYATHSLDAWNGLMNEEPYITYKPYFNAYRVDVSSAESGVDNDPQGVYRNTALNMTFWCSGIQRLLCADTTQVAAYAANAPGVDQTVALANSSTYGGAGYGLITPGGPATAAGGNSLALEILSHEMGHSLAKLEDEYVLNAGNYTGPEINPSPSLTRRNITVYDAASIASLPTKWSPWLGLTSPDGGSINAYVGASNGDTGVYRPSNSSKMRVLGVPFNLVSQEAIVLWIYTKVRPVDTYSPPLTQTLGVTDTAHVVPMQPVGHDLDLVWHVNGTPVTAVAGVKDLPIASLGLAPGLYGLRCVVTDNTTFVKDSLFRGIHLTQTLDWFLRINAPTATPSRTRSATRTSSPTATPSATRSATRTSSPTATPSATRSPTQAGSPTATPSVTRSPTQAGSPTATPTATDSPTPSLTWTNSETPTPSPSVTDSPTPSLTWTNSETPTPSPSTTDSPTPSLTWTDSPTPTLTASPSRSQTVTVSVTGSPTSTVTATASQTPTASPSATQGPSATITLSATAVLTGPLQVLRAVAFPQPNPVQLRLELAGPAERMELSLYSAAMRLLLRFEDLGAQGPGWMSLTLPTEIGLFPTGVYFYRVRALRGAESSQGVVGKIVIVK